MEKVKINYIVDLFLAISFLVTAITGLVLFFFLPGGIRRGGAQEFLGITKQSWADVHDWAGIILIVFAVIHLILHWSWFVNVTKTLVRKKSEK